MRKKFLSPVPVQGVPFAEHYLFVFDDMIVDTKATKTGRYETKRIYSIPHNGETIKQGTQPLPLGSGLTQYQATKDQDYISLRTEKGKEYFIRLPQQEKAFWVEDLKRCAEGRVGLASN